MIHILLYKQLKARCYLHLFLKPPERNECASNGYNCTVAVETHTSSKELDDLMQVSVATFLKFQKISDFCFGSKLLALQLVSICLRAQTDMKKCQVGMLSQEMLQRVFQVVQVTFMKNLKKKTCLKCSEELSLSKWTRGMKIGKQNITLVLSQRYILSS